MGLLSEIINKQLPRLDATRDLGLHAPALVKFSRPDINWSWYAVEFDGQDTFFGLIAGLAAELGRFRLSELETTCGYAPLLHDLNFQPRPLVELIAEHKRTANWAWILQGRSA